MTFTYDLDNEDETKANISKVRLELGDTIAGIGVKPDGNNFSDEELALWLDAESDHTMRTVIRVCDALSRMWSNIANISVGPRREELGKIAGEWANRAKDLRTEYGSTGGGSAFAVPGARVDGYSESASSSDL